MVKWNDENEIRLLLAIIHVMGASAPAVDWNTVAGLMGPGYTAGGISQKFTKDLKKRAAAQFGDGDTGEGNKTPVKRGAGKKATGEGSTKSAGSKRKAKGQTAADDDGGDDDDAEDTPSKKMKFKEEQDGENENED